jgi:phosphate starvation-inducible PhoH-like protein
MPGAVPGVTGCQPLDLPVLTQRPLPVYLSCKPLCDREEEFADLSQQKVQQAYTVESNQLAALVSGQKDGNLRRIERSFGVAVLGRGNELCVVGPPDAVRKAVRVLDDLTDTSRLGGYLSSKDVQYAIELAQASDSVTLYQLSQDVIQTTARGHQIRPKTLGQKKYVDAIRKNDIVFGIGPAGTGKTYLAVALAVAALKSKSVNRIILVRPAVEAGEHLGFLPGDLQNKVDPYLRPLYDALFDILGPELFERHRESNTIEIAPLAYMRGRTLDDAFIILDEAQNTTSEQMKMFLTRFGFGSKAVVTGDLTQVDLPGRKFSGLHIVQDILKDTEGIEFVYLTNKDVVRHELVQRIVEAYERYEGSRQKQETARKQPRRR